MKKLFLFSILALLALTLQAQHFEWVKAYSGYGGNDDPEVPGNIIKGSVVDRDGNIYVVGEYFPSSGDDSKPFGVDPVPTNLGVNLTQVNSSIVIAKLNPEGELLWHKGLHSVRSGSSGDGSLYSRGIKLLGDTAIMVCAYVYFPFENYRHDELYYLDTLLVDDDSRFGEIKTANDLFCCFMTLSLDGRLVEDHILEWCAADGNGEPIRCADTNYIETGHVQTSLFDVDSDGNIYLYNMANQYFYRNPTATKLGFVIDRRHIVFYRDDLNEGLWNWEIVKFSPHFDTVLKAIYVFDSTHTSSGSGINATSFRFDRDNNLYLGLYQQGGPTRLPLGNSDTFVLTYNNQAEYGNCLLIKYDTNLIPLWAKQTHSSPQSGSSRRWFYSRSVEFDYATNSIYLTGWLSKRALTDPSGNSDIAIFYDDDTLDLDNNFFWLRLDRDNGRLISYGKVRSDIATLGEVRDVEPRIVVANGKVAAMFNYVQAVSFADTTIDQAERQANGVYGRFTALAIWDEDGNELALHDLNAMGSYNRPGAVYAHDSILYITCSLTNGATFGDIEVPSSGGRSQAILAKYVNPIFSTGGHTPGTEGIDSPHSLTQSNNQAITIFPNPTTGILHIKPNTNALAQSNNLTITSLTIHNAMGQPVATNTITQSHNHTITLDLSPLPAGVYYLTVKSGETTSRHKVIKVN